MCNCVLWDIYFWLQINEIFFLKHGAAWVSVLTVNYTVTFATVSKKSTSAGRWRLLSHQIRDSQGSLCKSITKLILHRKSTSVFRLDNQRAENPFHIDMLLKMKAAQIVSGSPGYGCEHLIQNFVTGLVEKSIQWPRLVLSQEYLQLSLWMAGPDRVSGRSGKSDDVLSASLLKYSFFHRNYYNALVWFNFIFLPKSR